MGGGAVHDSGGATLTRRDGRKIELPLYLGSDNNLRATSQEIQYCGQVFSRGMLLISKMCVSDGLGRTSALSSFRKDQHAKVAQFRPNTVTLAETAARSTDEVLSRA